MISTRSTKLTAIVLAATMGLFTKVQTAQAVSEKLTVAGDVFGVLNPISKASTV